MLLIQTTSLGGRNNDPRTLGGMNLVDNHVGCKNDLLYVVPVSNSSYFFALRTFFSYCSKCALDVLKGSDLDKFTSLL